jgi:hypothetical protein
MRKLPPWLIPVFFGLAGLVMAHHPMMKDGLGWIQFDPGDTRFCNYLLEHGYRWLLQKPGHTELWSPPDFFPTEGHLAWAENMLGALPFYVPWRLVGFEIDTAFQLWILTLGALNFTAAYFLFRRCIKVDVFAASVGAALFAFAGMRINQTMHYQLFPQFFSIWAVHACWRLAVDAQALSEQQRTRWLAVLFFSVAGQFAVGIYLGWFLIFGLAFAGALGLLFEEGRKRVWFILKSHPFAIALLSLVSIAALLPIAMRYLGTAQEFGGRPFEEAVTMIPQPRAWFHFGPYSWWYSWLEQYPMFQSIPMTHEQRVGYGVVSTALCAAGVWFGRKDRALRFLGLMLVLLFVCTTLWGNYPDGFTLWKYIWAYFPGAKAIRGVSRVALLYLIGVSLFVAVALDRLRAMGAKLALLAIPLGLAVVIEQGETTPAFSKTQARIDVQDISNAIGSDCKAFFFSPFEAFGPPWKYQLDAMMTSLERNLPTINGYSGQNPPNWELGDPAIRTPNHEPYLAQKAQAWLQFRKVSQKVCWAKVALQEGPLRSLFVSQAVPSSLTAGQRATVSLKFKNIGERDWDPAQGFALGSQAPMDNTTWGSVRVQLPRVVKAGEEVDLAFEIVAPAEPGRSVFSWRMVQDRVAWFGNVSKPVEIDISATPLP